MKSPNLPPLSDSKIKLSIYTLITFTSIFWIAFNLGLTNLTQDVFGIAFGSLITLTSIFGASLCFIRSYGWGFYKSFMGQSFLFMGFALLMWSLGQIFFLYDSLAQDPLELYDFFFIFIDPFYILGIYLISKSIGTFKNFLTNPNLILLPILIMTLNYVVISYLTYQDPFTAFLYFDINSIFIAGSIVLATLVVSIMIFSKKLGGIYKLALNLILIGILFQFIGDNLFEIYESQQENGSLADYLFFLSVATVTYGVYSLDPSKLNEKRS